MKSSNTPQPPRAAAWLVSLFTAPEETESIMGDLLEEYSAVVSESGFSFARRRYWRQTLKTIPHLFKAGFVSAPWWTSAAIVVGHFLMVRGFRLEVRAIFAVMERYSVFDHHFRVYLFFASTGIEIGRILLSLFVGCAVGLVARGREMIATSALGLVFAAMAASAVPIWVARGQTFLMWTLPLQAAGWLAIVAGGALVRGGRSADGDQTSAA